MSKDKVTLNEALEAIEYIEDCYMKGDGWDHEYRLSILAIKRFLKDLETNAILESMKNHD